MITNFVDFAEAVKRNHRDFDAIPEEYLNDSGKAMRNLFNHLLFDLDFADSASDMLQLIHTGAGYREIDNADAIRKLRVIERCLEKIGN